ncbi:MAG: arsenite methyltransferase [Candidatus Eisenbacteria bacterium]|nr:arsenite methyltransferase [Candidatus Eisenbacteria bacterium]
MEKPEVRDVVREGYAKIARGESSCCGDSSEHAGSSSCCGSSIDPDEFAQRLGYAPEDLAALPEGTNLGLSCGNPTAIASLRDGEVVVDLGSGAGFDVLIAAKKVGKAGRAIGVDMTPEMISRSRANAARSGLTNVEFRLGEIENLPVADDCADVVISNCVINLSDEKPRVFREIARVLKPGGRVAVSDMALLRPLPAQLANDPRAYVGCLSGAVTVQEYLGHIEQAGLVDPSVEVDPLGESLDEVQDPLYSAWKEKLPAGEKLSQYVVSVRVTARKPS